MLRLKNLDNIYSVFEIITVSLPILLALMT